MRGIFISEPLKIELRELEEPRLTPGNAIIAVKSVGICGSDVTAYKGINPTMILPRLMGHELAGEILQIGENAQGLVPCDHVVLEPYFYCGHCYPCRKGLFNNCVDMNVLGVRMEGGMVEVISHPVSYLHKLPDSIPWEEAAVVEPLSIAVHATHRVALRGGEFAAISGAGTIGLLAALVCKAYGAKPILMDVLTSRLNFAKEMGIEYVIDLAKEDSIERVEKWTNGEMAPVVLECSGAQAAINNALELAANSGRICLVGWAKGAIEFNQPRLLRKELNLFGSRNSLNAFPECIDLIARKAVDVRPLLTIRHTLDEVMQGFIDLAQEPEKYLKIIGLL